MSLLLFWSGKKKQLTCEIWRPIECPQLDTVVSGTSCKKAAVGRNSNGPDYSAVCLCNLSNQLKRRLFICRQLSLGPKLLGELIICHRMSILDISLTNAML